MNFFTTDPEHTPEPPEFMVADATNKLSLSLIHAVETGDLQAKVWTPAHARTTDTLYNVLTDAIGAPDDGPLPALVRMWADCLKSADPAVRLPAQAILAEMVRKHTEFHGDEAVLSVAQAFSVQYGSGVTL